MHTILSIVLVTCLGAAGCTVHHHRPGVKTVRVLEAEHGRRDILVVTRRPGPDRTCWEHRNHWHCRRTW